MTATTMTLDDLLKRFFADPNVKLKIRKQETRDHYYRSIRLFQAVLGPILEKETLTTEDLNDDNVANLAALTLDEGHTEATANQRCKQLLALWRWAAKKRLVEEWPTVVKVREPERLPEAWRDRELAMIWQQCSRLRGWIGPNQASHWALGLHYWLYCTGERIEATLNITPAMIDTEALTARVPAQIRKGGLKAMTYRLTPVVVEHLQRLFRDDETPIFAHHWASDSSFYTWYRDKIVKAAGLPYKRHKSGPHKMRITVLTKIDMAGGDACDFARHSSRTVTDAYIDREMKAAQSNGVWPPVDLDPLRTTDLRLIG